MNLLNSRKGRAVEHIVFGKLGLLGYNVYPSLFNNNKGDCVIEIKNKFKKVEIKTVRLKNPKSKTQYIDVQSGGKHDYFYKDINVDFIIGYEPYTDKMYMIPKRVFKKAKGTAIAVKNVTRFEVTL